MILTASYDQTARIYEVASGKEVQVITGTSDLSSAVFSPDGTLLITESSDNYSDNTARIYELTTGKLLHNLMGVHGKPVFSPDGKLILIPSDENSARIFDVYSGKQVKVLVSKSNAISNSNGQITSVAFSLDGKFALLGGINSEVQLFNINNGNEITINSGHTDMINSVVFSHDGKFILSASGGFGGDDNTARAFDVATGKKLQVFRGHTGSISSAVFSPDGKLALTASDDSTARVFEVATGRELQVFRGHTAYVSSAVFSPDGKLALTASDDNTAQVFEVATGKKLQVFRGHTGSISSAVFSPDGKLALTASWDNTARVYNVQTGKSIHEFDGTTLVIKSVEFSHDGKLAISAINKVKSGEYIACIYNFSTGKPITYLSGHSDCLNSAVFSPDGKLALTAGDDSTARVFEVATGKELQVFRGHTGSISSAVFSPDGKLALTLNTFKSSDFNFIVANTARIYNVATGDLFMEMEFKEEESRSSCSAMFSPDNKLILMQFRSNARIYDIRSGKIKCSINLKKDDRIQSIVFSPDGKLIMISCFDLIARIYAVKTGKEIKILRGSEVISLLEWFDYEEYLESVVFSPDGKYVITARQDGTARIFDISTGKEIRVLQGNYYFDNSMFSPDGKKVLSLHDDIHQIRLWDFSSGNLIRILGDDKIKINSAQFSPNSRNILSTTINNIVMNWDVSTGNPIYELIQLENNNWMIKLPDSPYYMCSKDASKMLHYVTPSLKVIGFEQLDPVYNRPDIVLDSIGKYFGNSDGGMIDEYRKSWEKRIDRLGLDKEKLGKGESAVPNAEIVGADDLAYENNSGQIQISVKATDSKYPLRRFNVYVNEVPLYGSAGISIAHLKKQVWDTTVSVPLSMGENKIQVSVMNELGLENFKYPSYVNYTPSEPIVAKTYFIGIGVNEFKESSHNLKYCVKDVTDLSTSFGGPNTDVKLFTNAQVTKENILALKDYLAKTTVNDKVIISCSSHGLLDDSSNFYLATHDVDFNNPKARGLKYEELESLLDGIPARQKLLLLDACNSGENDKTEILKQDLAKNQPNMNKETIEGAKGVIIKLEDENKSNFKKMNELFVNVRNNTGSVIISAAGGQESALEAITVDGKSIENGAFSYCVLEYLKNNSNKPEELSVNKLKNYVEKRVEEITNGKQQPTSRQETMEIDWGLR